MPSGTGGITSIHTGQYHVCYVINGGLRCWGRNNLGQMGLNSTNASFNTPQVVFAAGSGVSAVSCGHSYVQTIVKGEILGFGDNNSGQLGNEESAVTPLPSFPLV